MKLEVLKNRILDTFPQSVRDRLWLGRRQAARILSGQAFPRPPKDRSSALALGNFGGFEVASRAGTADEAVISHSFEHDIFFPAVPEYVPAPNHLIVDVGAHIGTFALLAARKAGVVHAIEASRDSCQLLKINAALNGLSNIHCHHTALADQDGTATLFHDRGNWGHSTVADLSKDSEEVRALSLSSFFKLESIRECHFMKLNCEGADFPTLLSCSPETLRNTGCYLVLYHCDLWKQNSEDDLVRHFSAAGFSCAIRNKKTNRGWLVAVRED